MLQSIALQGRKEGVWEPEKVVFHGRYCLTGGKAHTHWDYKEPFLIPWQQFQLKYFMVWPECCGVHTVKALGFWVFFPLNKILPWKHILLVNQKRRLSSMQNLLVSRPAFAATFEWSPMVSSQQGYISGENMVKKYSGLTVQDSSSFSTMRIFSLVQTLASNCQGLWPALHLQDWVLV